MADARPLLDRLLKTPDLARLVPHLQPDLLHRVIQHCGLEDCAELVALASPEQVARMLDIDLWRILAPGADEALDVERFGVWLEVLMQAGAAVGARKLLALDPGLVIAGLAHHAAVFEAAAVSSFTTLDGEHVPGRVPPGGAAVEIGGYVIHARRASAWDAIVDLLAYLDAERGDYFHRLMRGCVRWSNGPREADGFHNLLEDEQQDMFDVALGREVRREHEGYVAPAPARAFLQAARRLPLATDPPSESPLVRAYFRAIEPAGTPAPPRESHDALPALVAGAASPLDTGEVAAFVDVLREAGVLTASPRALLQAPDGESARLASIEAYVDTHADSERELAFLANTVMAGCTVQGRPFTPVEASDAAMATCNLGLENWPQHWDRRDLVTAFQVGWTVLYRDVCRRVARHLIDIVACLTPDDRDIHLRLRALERALGQHLRDEAPWRARNALDVILMLDAPSWAGLLALIDECPVLHAAVRPSRQTRLAIDAGDFEFFAHNRQIEAVDRFLASLPAALTR